MILIVIAIRLIHHLIQLDLSRGGIPDRDLPSLKLAIKFLQLSLNHYSKTYHCLLDLPKYHLD